MVARNIRYSICVGSLCLLSWTVEVVHFYRLKVNDVLTLTRQAITPSPFCCGPVHYPFSTEPIYISPAKIFPTCFMHLGAVKAFLLGMATISLLVYGHPVSIRSPQGIDISIKVPEFALVSTVNAARWSHGHDALYSSGQEGS